MANPHTLETRGVEEAVRCLDQYNEHNTTLSSLVSSISPLSKLLSSVAHIVREPNSVPSTLRYLAKDLSGIYSLIAKQDPTSGDDRLKLATTASLCFYVIQHILATLVSKAEKAAGPSGNQTEANDELQAIDALLMGVFDSLRIIANIVGNSSSLDEISSESDSGDGDGNAERSNENDDGKQSEGKMKSGGDEVDKTVGVTSVLNAHGYSNLLKSQQMLNQLLKHYSFSPLDGASSTVPLISLLNCSKACSVALTNLLTKAVIDGQCYVGHKDSMNAMSSQDHHKNNVFLAGVAGAMTVECVLEGAKQWLKDGTGIIGGKSLAGQQNGDDDDDEKEEEEDDADDKDNEEESEHDILTSHTQQAVSRALTLILRVLETLDAARPTDVPPRPDDGARKANPAKEMTTEMKNEVEDESKQAIQQLLRLLLTPTLPPTACSSSSPAPPSSLGSYLRRILLHSDVLSSDALVLMDGSFYNSLSSIVNILGSWLLELPALSSTPLSSSFCSDMLVSPTPSSLSSSTPSSGLTPPSSSLTSSQVFIVDEFVHIVTLTATGVIRHSSLSDGDGNVDEDEDEDEDEVGDEDDVEDDQGGKKSRPVDIPTLETPLTRIVSALTKLLTTIGEAEKVARQAVSSTLSTSLTSQSQHGSLGFLRGHAPILLHSLSSVLSALLSTLRKGSLHSPLPTPNPLSSSLSMLPHSFNSVLLKRLRLAHCLYDALSKVLSSQSMIALSATTQDAASLVYHYYFVTSDKPSTTSPFTSSPASQHLAYPIDAIYLTTPTPSSSPSPIILMSPYGYSRSLLSLLPSTLISFLPTLLTASPTTSPSNSLTSQDPRASRLYASIRHMATRLHESVESLPSRALSTYAYSIGNALTYCTKIPSASLSSLPSCTLQSSSPPPVSSHSNTSLLHSSIRGKYQFTLSSLLPPALTLLIQGLYPHSSSSSTSSSISSSPSSAIPSSALPRLSPTACIKDIESALATLCNLAQAITLLTHDRPSSLSTPSTPQDSIVTTPTSISDVSNLTSLTTQVLSLLSPRTLCPLVVESAPSSSRSLHVPLVAILSRLLSLAWVSRDTSSSSSCSPENESKSSPPILSSSPSDSEYATLCMSSIDRHDEDSISRAFNCINQKLQDVYNQTHPASSIPSSSSSDANLPLPLRSVPSHILSSKLAPLQWMVIKLHHHIYQSLNNLLRQALVTHSLLPLDIQTVCEILTGNPSTSPSQHHFVSYLPPLFTTSALALSCPLCPVPALRLQVARCYATWVNLLSSIRKLEGQTIAGTIVPRFTLKMDDVLMNVPRFEGQSRNQYPPFDENRGWTLADSILSGFLLWDSEEGKAHRTRLREQQQQQGRTYIDDPLAEEGEESIEVEDGIDRHENPGRYLYHLTMCRIVALCK